MKRTQEHKFRNNITRVSVVVIVILVFLATIIGPLIIHILFEIQGPDWLVAKWEAGDILQYYGMLVTAIIAIAGLYFTFQDNRKGIQEQSRLDKLPFFSLTTLNYNVRNPMFATTIDKEIQSKGERVLKPKDSKKEYYYREEKLKAAVLVISAGKAGITTKLPEKDKELIINGGVAEQRLASGVISIVNEPMTYVPIILRNVGNGSAIDFRVGFNTLVDGELVNPQYLSSTSIDKEEDFYLGFYVLNNNRDNEGEYLLEIIYRDMFNNKYRQAVKFIIDYDDNGESANTKMEVEFIQKMIVP